VDSPRFARPATSLPAGRRKGQQRRRFSGQRDKSPGLHWGFADLWDDPRAVVVDQDRFSGNHDGDPQRASAVPTAVPESVQQMVAVATAITSSDGDS